jgi:hypothetical protein
MSKQIILQGVSINSLYTTINGLFWFPITSGAKAQSNGSAWTSASAAENTAIQSGTVLEESGSFQFPTGTTTANIKAYLLQYWTNRNTQINGVGPGLFANVFEDSVTGWSA